jgi:methanogenic corrinoid protein MtbC1
MLQELIARAGEVPPVPLEARTAYEAVADSLGAEACRALATLPDLAPARGGDRQDVLTDAIRHHPALMAGAFRLGSHELLARTFPWAYRVLASRGLPFDFWLFELRYWRRMVAARLAPPEAAPVLRIYDWLIEEHPELIRLSQDPETDPAQAGPGPDSAMRTFLALLLQGREADCLAMAESLADTSEGLAHFRHRVLPGALERVGLLWEWGHITAADEHVATAIGQVLLDRLGPPSPVPDRDGELAVTACAPGERHALGCRMLADSLVRDGWRVIHLGADAPAPDLIRLLRERRPFLLALSVGTAFNLGRAHALVQAIRSRPELDPVRIMAGGAALRDLPDGWRRLGAEGTAPDAPGTAKLAGAWRYPPAASRRPAPEAP